MGIAERRGREKEKRRRDILDAAEKLFFSKGFDAVTMDDVAGAAELSKGTLYLYFKNKIDIYFAISCRGLEILIGLFSQVLHGTEPGLLKVKGIGEAYCHFFKHYPNYFNALVFWDAHMIEANLDCPMADVCSELGNRALGLVAQAIAAGVNDGSIRPDLDPARAAIILWSQSTGVLQFLASKGEHFLENHLSEFPFKDLDEVVKYSHEMMAYSLRNPSQGGNKP
jgi:TetR/AcrR family transcriptional regulator